jgi:hypothetical protein
MCRPTVTRKSNTNAICQGPRYLHPNPPKQKCNPVINQYFKTKHTLPCNKTRSKNKTKKSTDSFYTATPLLFHPPGPLQAYTHNPIATQTLPAIAQKVDA